MQFRSYVARLVGTGALLGALVPGCGGGETGDDGAPPPSNTGGAGGSAAPTGGTTGDSGSGGSSTPVGGSGASGMTGGAGTTMSTGGSGDAPVPITPPPPEVVEMLDPNVDWMALTIVFPTMYSAYDGVHTFQVPAHVDMTSVELSGWSAIPAGSVTFDPDPDVDGGVLITVQQPVEQITIAAAAGPIGGTAALFITEGTPEQWEAGNKRYSNGVEFLLPEIDFASAILDPNWMPPAPPPDLACNNCHTTGAKYFEIQHSPTQAARFSDADLRLILAMGMKPPGIGFRILPEMLGTQTAVEIYAMYHKWEATEDEITGLIIYLRSITPTGQGDILLPDGTYVPPGSMLPTMP